MKPKAVTARGPEPLGGGMFVLVMILICLAFLCGLLDNWVFGLLVAVVIAMAVWGCEPQVYPQLTNALTSTSACTATGTAEGTR